MPYFLCSSPGNCRPASVDDDLIPDQRNMDASILVVDDRKLQRNLISAYLKKAGYTNMAEAADGREALDQAKAVNPDLILLDVGLPDISGYEVCRQLRDDHRTASILIIMLTARKMKEQIIRGLMQCADDYITKPYESDILLARVAAVLRRMNRTPPGDDSVVVRRGNLTIDSRTFELFVDQQRIKLTKTEFGILLLLAGRPGVVFTRQQIINHIWSEEIFISARVVDNQVANLRKKLGSARDRIESIYGVGYKFSKEQGGI